MINTLDIKQAQLKNGFFTIGSGMIRILILGSCRVCPYINYFEEFNKMQPNGDMFTIFSIDPFNHNWDANDERVDYMEALKNCETDERLLEMLGSIDYFIHEWYANAGMFNCSVAAENNIYEYGLTPVLDICIPSFNDHFILFNDIVNFDADMRKKAIQDINVISKLSDQTQKEIFEVSQRNLNKFYDVCLKSDLPEFKEQFSLHFRTFRFFHSYNHITKYFTTAIFALINDKFLNLDLTDQFLDEIFKDDMFANSYTKLTEYDIKFYGLNWGEEIVPLFG